MILYGLPSCDTCRKAMKALAAAGHPVVLRDVRAEPLTGDERAGFLGAFGARLVNRASTTWRGLSPEEQATAPEALLAAHPTLMKRPVIAAAGGLTLGWDKAVQGHWLHGAGA